MWWGIYVIACGITCGYYTVWSCFLMTLLIRFVTGVPLGNEVKYVDHPEWQQICEETNIFFPWFSKQKTKETQVVDEETKIEHQILDDKKEQNA